MKTTISTTIDTGLRELMDRNNVSLNKALELGAQIILADMRMIDYPDCELLKKMRQFQNMLEQANLEIERLSKPESEAEEDSEKKQKEMEKEADEVFDFK